MRVPEKIRKLTGRERRRIHQRIAREAERQRMRMAVPNLQFGSRPGGIVVMLLVMVIVGGALVGRSRRARFERAPKPPPAALAREELQVLRTALEDFRRDCRRYPATAEGLEALVHNPGMRRWSGPYVNLIKPDPWTNRYLYAYEDGRVLLRSCGPDGTPETADDLTAEPTAPAPLHAPAER
jgi:general secretion pathway protein G